MQYHPVLDHLTQEHTSASEPETLDSEASKAASGTVRGRLTPSHIPALSKADFCMSSLSEPR